MEAVIEAEPVDMQVIDGGRLHKCIKKAVRLRPWCVAAIVHGLFLRLLPHTHLTERILQDACWGLPGNPTSRQGMQVWQDAIQKDQSEHNKHWREAYAREDPIIYDDCGRGGMWYDWSTSLTISKTGLQLLQSWEQNSYSDKTLRQLGWVISEVRAEAWDLDQVDQQCRRCIQEAFGPMSITSANEDILHWQGGLLPFLAQASEQDKHSLSVLADALQDYAQEQGRMNAQQDAQTWQAWIDHLRLDHVGISVCWARKLLLDWFPLIGESHS